MSDTLEKWIALSHSIRAAGIELIEHSGKTICHVDPSDPRVIALALLARTLGHLKGTTVVAREGLIIEALTLARSCYENSFRIARLDVDGASFVREMESETVAGVRARGQTILQNEHDIEPSDKEGIRDVLRKIKQSNRNVSTLSPKDVAKKTTSAEIYLAYLVLSRDSHPTLSSLSRHIEYSDAHDKSPILVVEPTPATEQLEEALTFACTATVTACIGVVKMIGLIHAPPKLPAVLDTFNDLLGETGSDNSE